jgi:signal transduction histidine kinase
MEDVNAHPANSAEDLLARLGSQAAFVGSLTHALKGLLNGLEGGLYLVESGLRKEDPKRVESGTAMLQRNLGRARTLVGNTLYYAREREVQWEEMSLPEVISTCSKTCRRMAEQQGVTLETQAVDGQIRGDRFGLQALLANLAENAILACGSDNGTGGGRVLMSGSLDPPWAILEVAHDGPPMDRATLAGALGPVYTPSGSDRAGLWIHAAWRIATAHGGSLCAEPGVPSGERFVARLPAAIPGDLPSRPEGDDHGTT